MKKKEFYKIKTTLLHVHVVKTIPSWIWIAQLDNKFYV